VDQDLESGQVPHQDHHQDHQQDHHQDPDQDLDQNSDPKDDVLERPVGVLTGHDPFPLGREHPQGGRD
jgi:hypothetical protein